MPASAPKISTNYSGPSMSHDFLAERNKKDLFGSKKINCPFLDGFLGLAVFFVFFRGPKGLFCILSA